MTYAIPTPRAVVPLPEDTRQPHTLSTGVPTLDRILGRFRSGEVTLIDSGSTFVHQLESLLCVRNVLEHDRDVVFLDGGNAVNPHGMVSMGKRLGLKRHEILPRVNVARAFTCYQMATLVIDLLHEKLEETDASLLVLSSLPQMYLDEDVPYVEAHQLFLQTMRRVREVTEKRDVVCLVTNAGLTKLLRRKGIRRALYEGADVRMRFQHKKDTVIITHLDDYRREVYTPVAPNQSTLDEFEAGQRQPWPLVEGPAEVKEHGNRFLGW